MIWIHHTQGSTKFHTSPPGFEKIYLHPPRQAQTPRPQALLKSFPIILYDYSFIFDANLDLRFGPVPVSFCRLNQL